MFKQIKTERLEIRPIVQGDENDLCALLLNEEIKKTYMIPDFANSKALESMVNRFVTLSHSDTHVVRGLYRNGRLIGFVNDVEIKEGCIELGYVIHPSIWGVRIRDRDAAGHDQGAATRGFPGHSRGRV